MHVYLHVPFCRRRCSYCDFQIAVRRSVPATAFVRDLASEVRIRSLGQAVADTVYLGGGTPSLLPPDAVGAVASLVGHAPEAEVTIEANPEDVTPAAARAWRDAGINRVSLGVQTFDATVLAWMRRPHGPEAPARAMAALRDAGFANVSVDLIFGVPEHLARDLARDLDLVLALEPEHVSAYVLTVEPRTPLGRWVAAGTVAPMPDEGYEREFLATRAALTAAGFEHYEVSNHARPGHRARHNGAYWTGASYAGIGPGAHGFDGDERRWNLGPLAAWSRAVRAGRDPMDGHEVLTGQARRLETVYLGLRTSDGLPDPDPAVDAGQVGPMVAQGWLERRNGRLVATAQGWLRLDTIVPRLTTSAAGG